MFEWNAYNDVRYDHGHPAALRHGLILHALEDLLALNAARMQLEVLGHSYEGRTITCATLGNGPVRVLAWSQMHGNEPTHTAMLLDLIHFLQRFPDHTSANAILTRCTLHLVPMLNPDGAERYMRRNAQEIDINRDALHLQTPEGRILRQAVQKLELQFAFNLHNQNRLTSAGGDNPQPAMISLLVPPIDHADSQTPNTIQARRVAACFLEAVRDHCAGMITRYGADYMPRCFGEWVQQQGVATLTVEAGGWPDGDPVPLGQAHFVGFVRALESIATGEFTHANPADYDALPRSSEHNLFDLLVCSVRIVDDARPGYFTADLGINQAIDPQNHEHILQGWVEDLGDLSVTSGIKVVDGRQWSCKPGRFQFLPHVSPVALPSEEELAELLRAGVTTLIGRLECMRAEHWDALHSISPDFRFPLNIGFLVAVDADMNDRQLLTQLAANSRRGIVGCLVDGPTTSASELVASLQLPVFTGESLSVMSSKELALQLGEVDRARIGLESVADLVFLERNDSRDSGHAHTVEDSQLVLIAGGVVYDRGRLGARNLGRILGEYQSGEMGG